MFGESRARTYGINSICINRSRYMSSRVDMADGASLHSSWWFFGDETPYKNSTKIIKERVRVNIHLDKFKGRY